jgi:23S rRNA G2445 N2-methylase RlmL
VVVRATTGLEQLLASELLDMGYSVDGSSKRQLVISVEDETILTRPPRLADDLFIVAAETPDPGARRRHLIDAIESLRFDRSWHDQIPIHRPLAITASFVGKRNYSRFDIEDAIGSALCRHGFGTYASRRGGGIPPGDSVPWRVTLDGSTMYVGPRPFPAPLHRRRWRTETVLGSLHPPVAAAMVRLAGVEEDTAVIDPCCGAGTILLEARLTAPTATLIGRDLDPGAIAAAERNGAGLGIDWALGDASAIDPSIRCVDRIITNPPWGVRRAAGNLDAFLSEWRRVINPLGTLVVLLDEGQQSAITNHPHWLVMARYPVSVAGRHPCIFLARPR